MIKKMFTKPLGEMNFVDLIGVTLIGSAVIYGAMYGGYKIYKVVKNKVENKKESFETLDEI